MLKYLFAATIGAALAYFLDPDRGRRRRNVARDRIAATIRRTSRRVESTARYAASTAEGLSQRAAHMGTEYEPLDDATLAHKVETELFRDPGVPKGKININSEHGVIKVRGEVEHPEEINAILAKVRDIPGVVDVENLLHLPDTHVPMTPP